MLALQDKKYQALADCTKQGAMIFLGTPHRGSESATSLHRILSATIGSKPFVQELMRNSATLTAINEDFRHCAKDLSLWSFRETQPTTMGPGKSVVRFHTFPGLFTKGADPWHRCLWILVPLLWDMKTSSPPILMRIITP